MIKIIAIGNRLVQDDGIAIEVAEKLKNKMEMMGFEVVISETDFQFCFHLLREDDFVIILDAAYTGAEPASIHVYKLQEAISKYRQTRSQHEVSIFDLIGLYLKSLEGYVIGIEIAESGIGDEVSEVLKGKFDDICIKVERIICKIMKED